MIWLNADDRLEPGALAQVARDLEQPFDMVYGDCLHVDSDGRVRKRYRSGGLSVTRLLTKGCTVFSGSALLHRRLVERVGPFDTALTYCMDLDFFLRAAPSASWRYRPTPIGHYRLHPETKTTSRPWGFFLESFSVRRRYAAGSATKMALGAWGQLRLGAYIATRPVWLSDTWTKIKAEKRF